MATQYLNEYELFNRIRIIKDEEKRNAAIKEFIEQLRYNKLYFYRPYGHPDTLSNTGSLWKGMNDPLYLKFLENAGFESNQWQEWSDKHWQLDFHKVGRTKRERLQLSANRIGKTKSGAMEVAFHMTGLYPDWWEGRRFNHPVLVWTGSPTNETSREVVQKELLGGLDKENKGTGTIPRNLIYGNPKTKQAGVSGVVDSFKVRHISGGISECILKTYEQGWRKWQGSKPHVVMCDEEPEDNDVQGRIPSEVSTRVLTVRGIVIWTFTPLLGQTKLILKFMNTTSNSLWMGNAGWDDAPHLGIKEKQELMADYPNHEIQARTQGVPMLGEGAIFKVPENELIVRPFQIPDYFARIKGVDFGIDHPASVVDIAWDRDKDVIYVTRAWRKSDVDISTHAEVINQINPWVPVSWPHDGAMRERSSGREIMQIYKTKNVKFLSRSARYENDKGGSQPQWPIIKDIQEREENGGIKYFSSCTELLEERRNYHTKGGKIVPVRDDTLKALFYAVMMKRFSMTQRGRKITAKVPTAMTMRL